MRNPPVYIKYQSTSIQLSPCSGVLHCAGFGSVQAVQEQSCWVEMCSVLLLPCCGMPVGLGAAEGPLQKNTNLQPSLYDALNGHRHGAHTAAVQQFVLQPVGSLREVPIRKMMNRIYTGGLFQMWKIFS